MLAAVAPATMNIMVEVLEAAEMNTLPISLKENSLYTNLHTRRAYTTAKAPASVGVNQPKRMPPTIRMGMSRAGKESIIIFFASAQVKDSLSS